MDAGILQYRRYSSLRDGYEPPLWYSIAEEHYEIGGWVVVLRGANVIAPARLIAKATRQQQSILRAVAERSNTLGMVVLAFEITGAGVQSPKEQTDAWLAEFLEMSIARECDPRFINRVRSYLLEQAS